MVMKTYTKYCTFEIKQNEKKKYFQCEMHRGY